MRRCVFVLSAAMTAVSGADSSSEFFETKVRPVLAANCYSCHTTAKMGGLALNSREALLKGGNSGPAIVTGDPSKSLLIQAVRHEHAKLKMPPAGEKLPAAQVDALAAWIKDGAPWPAATSSPTPSTPDQRAFWSLKPVPKPRSDASIDSLQGGKRNVPADKRTLIRRATHSLTGLPPTPEEVDAFLADKSPGAFEKVVDRLLASPRYGERWSRLWLDIARYADDRLTGDREEPRVNAHHYRDWVIRAFNDDLPYDQFIKAQIAGDLMGKPEHMPALGFYGLSPEFQDDRVDVTTRGFMALTAACAQCHDHKFDPIPSRDFYALQGVFSNTEPYEHPLAPSDVVEKYEAAKKKLDTAEEELKQFADKQTDALAEVLAHQSARYLAAARAGAITPGLDDETFKKFQKFLEKNAKDPSTLFTAQTTPEEFQALVIGLYKEHHEIEEENNIRLGGSKARKDLSQADLRSFERNRYVLWREFFNPPNAVFTYGEKKLDRWLSGQWKSHLDEMRARVETAKKALPEKFPFVYAIKDKDAREIKNLKIHLRGNPANLGDEAPRAFLSALCDGPPKPFAKGSGRIELADAIASKENPLTARVIVNRIWAWHFGDGLVKTQSNFGRLGEKPANQELLDYLAWRLMDNGWSVKKLQREIVLSGAYQAVRSAKRRLDVEQLRDSILFTAGTLDLTLGGPAQMLDDKNKRRTVYAWVSRRRPDRLLGIFDFPNATATSEQRVTTDVPLQRLYLLNSPAVTDAADAIAKRTEASKQRLDDAYRIVLQRKPSPQERKLAAEYFARKGGTWPEFVQVLLASDEFLYTN